MDIKMENSELDTTIELEQIHLYCRVCLQMPRSQDVLNVNVVCDEDESLTYKDVLKICTEIDLLADFTLPCRLCKSCGIELQMVYDFHKKVKEAKGLLIQIKKQTENQQDNKTGMDFINLSNLPKVKTEPLDSDEILKDSEVHQNQNLKLRQDGGESAKAFNMNKDPNIYFSESPGQQEKNPNLRLYTTERDSNQPYDISKDAFTDLYCTDSVSKKMAMDVLHRHGYFIGKMFNGKRHRLRALIYGVWRLVRVSRGGNIKIDTLPPSKLKFINKDQNL